MIVLVTGGRDYGDWERLYYELDGHHTSQQITLLIHGGAAGADDLASDWADSRLVRTRAFIADWEAHGKAAGPMRNQRMIDEGKPDLVIAFPGGKGTADCVRRAKAAGIRVIEIA